MYTGDPFPFMSQGRREFVTFTEKKTKFPITLLRDTEMY